MFKGADIGKLEWFQIQISSRHIKKALKVAKVTIQKDVDRME